MVIVTNRETARVTSHRGPNGKGRLGGKGNSAVLVDGLSIPNVRKPRVHVLSTYFFQLFQEKGLRHPEVKNHLRAILACFGDQPISVRSSADDEIGELPTAGKYISYMLPNSSNPELRLEQMIRAIELIFENFLKRRSSSFLEIGIEIRAIKGVRRNTDAGAVFYPLISGVADSKLLYPCGPFGPEDGFARIALGHGYSTVIVSPDERSQAVPVIGINSGNPIPVVGRNQSQTLFWAVTLNGVEELSGDELETMSRLNVMRFADPDLLALIGDTSRGLKFGNLVTENRFGFSSGLRRIMAAVSDAGYSSTQVEFTFNIEDGTGIFDVVQTRSMRSISPEDVIVPTLSERTILSSTQVQGHEIIPGIKYAVVVSPSLYSKDAHVDTVRAIREVNDEMKRAGERFVFISPGRIGTTNHDWGLYLDFADISNAAVIAEYGYDISGSAIIPVTRGEMTGGIYGSHFLYALLGGMEEAERIRALRACGSQGSHFMTNLITAASLFVFVKPDEDVFDQSLFSPEGAKEVRGAVIVKEFPKPVTAYGNLFEGRCVVQ